MNMEVHCCNRDCGKELFAGQVVYEIGPLRYCQTCVVINVVRYPRLQERRDTKTLVVPRQPERRGAGTPIRS